MSFGSSLSALRRERSVRGSLAVAPSAHYAELDSLVMETWEVGGECPIVMAVACSELGPLFLPL